MPGSAAVVPVDFQGAGLVVEVVAAQVVDGSAAAGDAHPAAGGVALFVDAGGAVELLRTELPRSRIAEGRSFTLPSAARRTQGCPPKLISG